MRVITWAGASLTFIAMAVLADTASVPNTFSNGTVADADQVNANFANLDNRLHALENLPEVSVICGGNADALQEAIDATPPGGQKITVTGTCNGVRIFDKRNLSIDGQGSTTILGINSEDTLDIGLSQGVFISGVTVNANNIGESAVRVGASTAIFTDLVASNSAGGSNLAVNTNGIAVLTGTTVLGDADDVRAIEMDERGAVFAEGDVTLQATTAMDLADFSFFDQDSQGSAANTLDIDGDVLIGPMSRMEMENGSITGNVTLGGGSFLGRTGGGQALSITGVVNLTRSSIALDTITDGGGTMSLSGARLGLFYNSFGFFNGPGIDFAPTNSFTFYSSQLKFGVGPSVDPTTNFFTRAFSIIFSGTVIDAAKVGCPVADSNWAQYFPPGSLDPSDPNAPGPVDLCGP